MQGLVKTAEPEPLNEISFFFSGFVDVVLKVMSVMCPKKQWRGMMYLHLLLTPKCDDLSMIQDPYPIPTTYLGSLPATTCHISLP